jgi:transposase
MIRKRSSEENTVQWVGVDVAKRTFQAALARPGERWDATALRQLPTKNFPRTHEGVEALVGWLAVLLQAPPERLNARVVMETTGKYSTELAAWMNARHCGLCPAIVHAQQTSAFIKSMNVRGKTDALEARALAFYGVERAPAAYEALPDKQRQLRELVRHRAQLVQLKLALSNRQGEGSEYAFISKSQEKLCRAFEREIKRIEEKMRLCIVQSEPFRQDVRLLCSIYGVAFLTACVILAELGDLRRFDRARQLSAYAGLSPRQVQSGSSVFQAAHLCKQGNSMVRKALYMASLTAIHDGGLIQVTYQSALQSGKPKMVALGIVMRKLLVLMRALLISGKCYDPQWKTQFNSPRKEAVA